MYEWDQYRDECFRLYITERRPLEEIMQYMKDNHNFAPSKRAFQTQFKRWDFPSKQNPAHRNVDLVTRVRELWEQNYSQRDMVKTLNDEGFQIKERELMRVRAKNRWLLRIPNGQKATPEEDAFQQELLAAAASITDEHTPLASKDPQTLLVLPTAPVSEEIPEEILRKRKERHEKMKAESDERWATKKRRRRTRDYAGIPADPPGPPRFPSETTLGESMEFLLLDGELYKQVRANFQAICEDMRIIKKTLAGTDKWAMAKNRLIQENDHLNAVFADPQNKAPKELALDVICTDVTKRMRTVETRMTIVDAKNTLGVNPEQSRQIRNSFYLILQNDHFTSKLETGPEHWNELKEQWVASTPLLQNLMNPDQDKTLLAQKKKALEVLCRDVMKRLRDAQKRDDSQDPTAPKPTTPKSAPAPKPRTAAAPTPVSAPLPAPAQPTSSNFELGDLQIDPSLLQAADFEPAQQEPIAVYIKPHPQSQIHASDKMFLATLSLRKYSELEEMIRNRWKDTVVARVEGLATAENGNKIPFPIEDDDELEAYLDHVQGSKIIFLAQVNQA